MTRPRNEVRTVNLTGGVSGRDEFDLQTKIELTESLSVNSFGPLHGTLMVYHETVTLLLVTLRSQR